MLARRSKLEPAFPQSVFPLSSESLSEILDAVGVRDWLVEFDQDLASHFVAPPRKNANDSGFYSGKGRAGGRRGAVGGTDQLQLKKTSAELSAERLGASSRPAPPTAPSS